MAIREIVVHVTHSDTLQPTVEQARRLAERHAAHLVGQYVIDIPSVVGYATVEIPADLLTIERENAFAQAAEAKAAFERFAETDNRHAEWRQDEGLTVNRLCISARRADLLIMGLAQDSDAEVSHGTIASTLLSAGVPVLLVPTTAAQAHVCKFVTIGWDGGREATRAVHDALPILQQAEMVSVVCIDPATGDRSPHGDLPGAGITHWLARHGVSAQAQTVISGDKGLGEALLDWAKGQGSDLIVTGGYGHSRVRELLLGGVTRDLLRNTEVPVLMSH